MADLSRIRVVGISLILVALGFGCKDDGDPSAGGTGGENVGDSPTGVSGQNGEYETSGTGGVTEGSPRPDAGNMGGMIGGEPTALPGADAGDGRKGRLGPDAGDSGTVTGSDSAVAPNADAGDSGTTADSQSDIRTGEETWSGPYANVVAVSTSGTAGSYTFNVSIESADVDCSQYASWWEVVTEDGSLVFRRILEHSHTDENGTTDRDAPGNTFTRSGGPIDIAADEVVIVRAHMNTGGYHGDAMRGSVVGGFAVAPEIGAEFATDVEFDEPQPTTCRF